ncbi:DegV family protein [Catenisphaera adipataccumulans]|uniref:DegV family protein with EDD domain n=1 Tax=Catenisphaera adipataccumulans TaxID=700500 RepID=A0A7W8D080_9FIRM|nr:DegV family protein [Catenisphaera adipataccumulans]MBB5183708.1 DegV family protein with EDD domain [Catenisphaera adipataccumulans]
MVKIVTDSASHYSRQQAADSGMYAVPLMVTIDHQSYRDYEEITDVQLLKKINEGKVPSTSQPSIGEKVDIYNEITEQGNEVIDITMADGLSGTYQSALIARESCDHPEMVTVFNSKTLCVPEHILVAHANQMAQAGRSKEEIMTMLEKSIATDDSFMIPIDFQFLLRGGRTNNASAFLGGLLKLIPIIRRTDDAKRLEKYAIARTYKRAFGMMMDHFEKRGVDSTYTFCLAHAQNEELAAKAAQSICRRFGASVKIVVMPLCPSFIVQGGPGCLAFQTIKIIEK